MSQSFKPKGMPALIPYLTVSSPDESVAFYQDVCQFNLLSEPKIENNKILHAEMGLGEAVIMMGAEGACGSTQLSPKVSGTQAPLNLYIYVPDVDAHYAHAKKHGAKIAKAPEDMFWGDRFYQLEDIDGYQWCFATHVGEHQK